MYEEVCFAHVTLDGCVGACFSRNLDPQRRVLVHFQVYLHIKREIFARGKFSPISPVSSSGENLTGENFVG